MKPLSGLDASFLYAETATTPMNVLATLVVEGRLDPDAVLERVRARLPQLPPFRRRLVEMPLGLDHPVWIEDPDFDLSEHVTRVQAPPPGDARALELVVARLARRRLDRARPLWELALVEGLAEERTALVVKAHHAAMDGVSGAALLLHLFDRPEEAGPGPEAATDPWRPEREPGAAELVGRGLGRLLERPRVWGETLLGASRAAADVARAHLASDPEIRGAPLPFQAPASPFNGPLSSGRTVAYARTPFAALQQVRSVFGGSLNDVVMAACTRALREELLELRALTPEPLVAAVPVSTRRIEDPADSGNRLSAFLTHLPVQLEDPLHQLSEVSRASRRAKRLHGALGDRTLASLAELVAPGPTAQAFQAYGRWGLASSHRPLYNLVVSNVPGPPFALSMHGRPVRSLHPHGPMLEGAGLNITVMSYAGSVDVGVLACRERVPEAHRIADRVAAAFEELAKLAESRIPDAPELARAVA